MIKLVVIDLDGTLLDHNKRISDENIKALKKSVEKGIEISISTGRSYISAKDYIEELELDIPVVYQNGALILHGADKNEILRAIKLNSNHASSIVLEAKKENVNCVLYRDFFEFPDMYIEKIPDTPYASYYENNHFRIRVCDNLLDYVGNDGVVEVALEGPERKIKKVVEKTGVFSEKVSVIKNNTIKDHSFYEFFGPEVQKSIGLNYLRKVSGYSKNEVAYIGDNYNDLDVMKEAGFSVAMKNAPEDVKKHADYVTSKTNDESGVAEAVEKILEGFD
ncbi:MAG: HAD family phosphatase [Kosmotoga sp.]|nr:MAG: HAD family phosphatase [Kosmotoga sp.]